MELSSHIEEYIDRIYYDWMDWAMWTKSKLAMLPPSP